MTADEWITRLGLEKHVEGGYFKEVYRSPLTVSTVQSESSELSSPHSAERSLSTTIYFLLKSSQFSAFHRLKSDEVWFYHCGSVLRIHQIDLKGVYTTTLLGRNFTRDEVPQYLFPAGVYFAVEPVEKDSYSLVSCMVSPGFDYRDFELASYDAMIEKFPQNSDVISIFARR